MINIFRLFVWQPWIRLLPKTNTINDKVIDEKYSKSTFLKKNVSLTSNFFPSLTNDLKHLSFRIKKNTNRTEPFLCRFLCKQQLLYNHFLERPGVIKGINELVSDDMWSYMQWRLKGKCFNFLCSIGQVGICECFSAIGTSTNVWVRCCKVLQRNICFSNGKSHELPCRNFACADSSANCSSICFVWR